MNLLTLADGKKHVFIQYGPMPSKYHPGGPYFYTVDNEEVDFSTWRKAKKALGDRNLVVSRAESQIPEEIMRRLRAEGRADIFQPAVEARERHAAELVAELQSLQVEVDRFTATKAPKPAPALQDVSYGGEPAKRGRKGDG